MKLEIVTKTSYMFDIILQYFVYIIVNCDLSIRLSAISLLINLIIIIIISVLWRDIESSINNTSPLSYLLDDMVFSHAVIMTGLPLPFPP